MTIPLIPINPSSFPHTFPTALAQEVAERPGEWSPEQKQQVEEKLASLGTATPWNWDVLG